MARCNTCEAEIRWVTHFTSGKALPLEVTSSPKGRYVILLGDCARPATDEDVRLHRPRYDCHWDVCPERRSGGVA